MAQPSKISRTSYSPPPASSSADTSQDYPHPPAPPSSKVDKSAPKDYNITVRSQMAIPDNYKREENYDGKYEKLEGGNAFVRKGGKPNKQRNNRK